MDGEVGDQDPIAAVHETWDPTQYDEVVVSTLPTGASRWLQVDLPHRVERLTSVPVTHVVAHPERPAPHADPARTPERQGVLAPFAALSGRRPDGRPARLGAGLRRRGLGREAAELGHAIAVLARGPEEDARPPWRASGRSAGRAPR